MERRVLSDKQWALMAPHCLGKPNNAGRRGTDKRLFVEAVLLPDVAAARPAEAVEREGQELLKRIRPRDCVVLLREDGTERSSRELASFLSERMEATAGRVVMVVGGPWGTSRGLGDRADALLSLSRMTFTHEMCFLFLAEQLYRAFSILAGTEYHH